MTDIRGFALDFAALWERAEELHINEQLIKTLSRRDALLHACCHAAVDRWDSLRNLVDIERLQRRLPSAQRIQLVFDLCVGC